MVINIGGTIKTLRKRYGLSQEKLARELGVSSQAVSKWERGLAFPDITLLRPIAEFFGITVDMLTMPGEFFESPGKTGVLHDIYTKLDNLEQIIKTAANEATAIRKSLAVLEAADFTKKGADTMTGNTVWKAEIKKLELKQFSVSALQGDNFYHLAENGTTICRYDIKSGADSEICEISDIQTMCAAPDDSLRVLTVDRTNPEGYKYSLHTVSGLPDKAEIESFELSVKFPIRGILSISVTADRNGNTCLRVFRSVNQNQIRPNIVTVYVINSRGEIISELDCSEDNLPAASATLLSDGRAAVVMLISSTTPDSPGFRYCIAPINPETGGWDERIYFDIPTLLMTHNGYGKYLFFAVDSSNQSFCGYNTETGKIEQIFSCVEAGVKTSQILCASHVGDEGYRVVSVSVAPGQTIVCEIATVTRTGNTDNRIRLTFGSVYYEANIMEHIHEFNRKNEKYRIDIVDYKSSELYSQQSADTVFEELCAGNTPDVISLAWLPKDYFAEKGLFTDLFRFLDTDDKINRQSFLPGVIKLFERGGRLPYLAASLCINAYCGRAGAETEMTFEKLHKILDKTPGATVTYNLTREYALHEFLMNGFGSFIDWKTGETRFISPEFERLLELCKRHPASPGTDIMGFYAKPVTDALRDGDFLFDSTVIGSTVSLQTPHNLYGEDYAIMPYPSLKGHGFSANHLGGFAISENCKHKEAAWSFIRDILLSSDAMLTTFSILKENFDREVLRDSTQEYMTLPEDYDSMPEVLRKYYDSSKRDASGRILKPKLTMGRGTAAAVRTETYYAAEPGDAEVLLGLIEKTDRLVFFDSPLLVKLREAVKPYFEDEITVKEAAAAVDKLVRERYGFASGGPLF